MRGHHRNRPVTPRSLGSADSFTTAGYPNTRTQGSPHALPRDDYAIIRAAEEGLIRAYTSVLTMGEVVYIKAAPGKEQLAVEAQEEIISQLLNSPWLEHISFEPDMAEINRYLLRQYGGGKRALRPYDSVHIATAIRMKVNYFDTIDNALIERLPNVINYPPRYDEPVIIQRPFVDKLYLQLPST